MRGGGHGTESAKKEYINHQITKYKIQVILQCPRSPCTNALDLGVWCTLQHHVEVAHFGKRVEAHALARSVEETWMDGKLTVLITNVFTKLNKILLIILKYDGSTKQCEFIRGTACERLKLNGDDEVKLQIWNADADVVNEQIHAIGEYESDDGDEIDDDF